MAKLNLMAKPEKYSTEKAWGFNPQENAQAKMFERLANGLRKELASKDIYIEQLEAKVESLRAYQKNHMKGES